jgi:polyisoprenoid-binding protein YceI
MATTTPGRWALDPTRSTVAISHKTMWGMATVKGSFKTLSGDGEVRADGTVTGTLVLDAASIDTKHTKRDKHLRSADFFHTDEHPSIVFTVDSAVPAANGTAEIDGQLTVRGVTRPLSFTAQTGGTGTDDVTLTGELTVDRAWFGLDWNQLGMLRGPATVTLNTHFVRDSD